uniref:HTH CENPB-type domain-containing protein n=1 Tax=Ditylenchus dipsaci TaxID=166011 RepID=A0A915E8V3_9BILA
MSQEDAQVPSSGEGRATLPLKKRLHAIWDKFERIDRDGESATDGKNKKKHPGGGRPLKFKDLDTQLAAWVRERRSKKLKVSRRTIQMKAQQMVSAEEDGEGCT